LPAAIVLLPQHLDLVLGAAERQAAVQQGESVVAENLRAPADQDLEAIALAIS